MSQFQRYILGMVLIILGVNIVGSWAVQYVTWQKINQLEVVSNKLATELQNKADVNSVPKGGTPTFTPTPVPTSTTPSPQAQSPITQRSFMASPSPVVQPVATVQPVQSVSPASSQSPANVSTQATPQIKEQTIFIGSGSSSDTNWDDIDTASVELNSYNYPSVKRVVFEATLSILGGEAGARLINKTTGEVIYPSVVSHNTSTATTKLSSSFNLDRGSNVYVVQLRSSSNEMAVLDGSRLRMFY